MVPTRTGTGPTAVDPAHQQVAAAAQRLRRASDERIPCAPVRDLIDASDGRAAYQVQARLTADRTLGGAVVVGRKVGLTSAAVQRQLGVDQPDFGVLFDDMRYVSGDVIPMSRLLQPKVEAEVAFVLSADLTEGGYSAATVRRAVDHAAPAIEVVDSRIRGWDISFCDTVADNASCGLFVIGSERRTLEEFEPAATVMRMTVDGDIVSTGRGSACLGDPLNALAWLANKAVVLGDPLRAGHLVLSGALGPMSAIRAGSVVQAHLSGLGSVTCSFEGAPEEGR